MGGPARRRDVWSARAPLARRVPTVAECHTGGAREWGGANVRGTRRRIAETCTPATRQPRAGRCAACEIAARGAMYVYRPTTKYVRTYIDEPCRTRATRSQTPRLRPRRYVAHRTHFEAPFLNWVASEDPRRGACACVTDRVPPYAQIRPVPTCPRLAASLVPPGVASLTLSFPSLLFSLSLFSVN